MAEPIGTRRHQARNQLDLGIEKVFNISSIGTLGVFLDITNAFGDSGYAANGDKGGRIYNDGTFQQWPTYGQLNDVWGLRTFKVSARFTF